MKKKIYNIPTLSITKVRLVTTLMGSNDKLPASGNQDGQGTGGIGVPARRLYV